MVSVKRYLSQLSQYTRIMYVQCTQLFLGAQCVEAGLMDDLTEEFQQHVVMCGLHVRLVVNLYTTVIMDLIPLLVHIPAT